MCTEQGFEVRRTLRRFRVRHGALRYRRRLGSLSPMARETVYLFEQSLTPISLIEKLAIKELRIPARELTSDERRVGEVLFRAAIREIAEAFRA
jgi:hypothetical protein